MRSLEPVAERLPEGLEPGRQRVELLGWGDVGHGELVRESIFVYVERGRHVEDRAPVLDRDHPAGGERPAVADAVDLVEDRNARVPWPEEVGVQRVRPSRVDRAAGRGQRLSRHLPAEDALAVLVRTHPAEDVHFDRFEIEQVDEEVEIEAHATILSGHYGERPCRP